MQIDAGSTSRRITRTFDQDGQLVAVKDWDNRQTDFGYDADGHLADTTYPTSTQTVDRRIFNANGELTSVTFDRIGGALATITYGRDLLGRVSQTTPTGLPGDSARGFTYSPLGQLSSSGPQQLTHDSADNLTALTGVRDGDYDPAGQVQQFTTADDGQVDYDFDAAGRRTADTPLAGLQTGYDYDDAGALKTYHPPRTDPQLAGGWVNAGALSEDGNLRTWGWNAFGQLGDGTTTNSSIPIEVTGMDDVVGVAAGSAHTLALRSAGSVWAWGANNTSQLGPNQPAGGRSVPVAVQGLTGAKAISAGWAHNLALLADGTVKSWGAGANGRLGNGTTADTAALQTVTGLNSVKAVAAGYSFSAALKTDGTVWTWGANNKGQLGDGTITDRSQPVQVSGLSGIVKIALGTDFALALDSAGRVWTWGTNAQGQQTRTGITHSATAQLALGIPTATAIAAGGSHGLALASGLVYSWGLNTDGQLGNGTLTNRTTPAAIANLSGVTAIAGGIVNSFAKLGNGTAMAWGGNTAGQIGDTTTTRRTTPTAVSGLQLDIPQPATTYTYDADNLRASKTTAGVTTRFTWDVATSGLPLLLDDGQRTYLYGPDDQPIAHVTRDGVATYYHHDQLGSTRLLTDQAGQVGGTYTYDTHGAVTAHTGTASTQLQFAGQYTDAETGLQYLRARYYDPATGQFLTRDPIEDVTGDAYGYADGDPVNYTDPSGLIGVPGWIRDVLHEVTAGGSDYVLGEGDSCNPAGLGGLLGDAASLVGLGKLKVPKAIAEKVGPRVLRVLQRLAKDERGAFDPGEYVDSVLRRKKGAIQHVELPPGGPSWDEVRNMTMGEIQKAAKANRPGFRTLLKVLGDKRFDKKAR